jgi:hypothetical protein
MTSQTEKKSEEKNFRLSESLMYKLENTSNDLEISLINIVRDIFNLI